MYDQISSSKFKFQFQKLHESYKISYDKLIRNHYYKKKIHAIKEDYLIIKRD